MRRQFNTLGSLFLPVILALPAAGQTTWTIDDNGTADFVHIQDAVDVAQDGDVLFVMNGAYASFTIDGKSLVVAGAGGNVRVAASVVVRNLAAGQRVELDNLCIGAPFANDSTVILEDNLGSIRLVDCEIQTVTQSQAYACYCGGFTSLECSSSESVVFLRSTIPQGYGLYGRPSVSLSSCNLLVTDSTIHGSYGDDGAGCQNGTPGGSGIHAWGTSTLDVVGSVISGGPGGLGSCSGFDCQFCPDGPDGVAVALSSGVTGHWKASTFDNQPGPETGPFARTEFASFCFGTWDECPCGNNGASAAGCNTSYDSGGVQLTAAGNPSVSADTVTLSATGFRPTGFPGGLFFQGTTQAGSGMGAVFNDGLLCATGEIIRLKGKIAMSGSMTLGFGNPADQPVSVRGALPAGGGTRVYQVWYRNQAPQFCTSERFNMSNGLEITWLP